MKKKEFSNLEKEPITTLSIHSVTNILGNHKREDFEATGANLTQTDHNVLMAIARAFSATNYQGNLAPVVDKINPFVQMLPRIQITRAELLKILEIKPTSRALIDAVFASLEKLNSQMFNFRYERLCYDENGLPIKTRAGKWKKQLVETKDSLFRIKYLRHQESKQLQALEIVISSVFVDQRESYFLSIPESASKELQNHFNSKRVPAALLNFILYLRYQQEIRRRGKRSWKLDVKWNDLAKVVRISQLSIQRKKGDVLRNLDKAMEAAKDLGYLKSWKFFDDCYCVVLYPPKTEKFIRYENMLDNKSWAEKMVEELPKKPGVVISATEEYLEVYGASRAGDARIISYDDPSFREKAMNMIEKYNKL